MKIEKQQWLLPVPLPSLILKKRYSGFFKRAMNWAKVDLRRSIYLSLLQMVEEVVHIPLVKETESYLRIIKNSSSFHLNLIVSTIS